MKERPLKHVPIFAFVLFAAAICAQFSYTYIIENTASEEQSLPPVPSSSLFSLAGLGEKEVAARAALLWLQSFDMQNGLQISYKKLDYNRLTEWLSRLYELNPESSYTLLLATHIYANTPNTSQKRQMLDFVHQMFLKDPDRHWRWMTHAASIARHQLQDMELALKYAESLRTKTNPQKVPGWARQMSVFLLDDMEETEAAAIILGGLLESDAIDDEHERVFLVEKLRALEEKSSDK